MELQRLEIEGFRAVYERVSGETLSSEKAASMAQDLLELMNTLTDDYELYIDMSRDG